MIFNIMTFNIVTLSIKIKNVSAERDSALSDIMLTVIVLNVTKNFLPSVVKLSAALLNVISLNVVAPYNWVFLLNTFSGLTLMKISCMPFTIEEHILDTNVGKQMS